MKSVSRFLSRPDDLHPVPHREGISWDSNPGHNQKPHEESNQSNVLLPPEGEEPSATSVENSGQSLDGSPGGWEGCEASNAIPPFSEGWEPVGHSAG